MLNPRSGAYGGGYGDFFGYQDLLVEWRANGDFEGFELDETAREQRSASVAVVTGGAVGIGAAIAEELGRQARSSSPSTPASTVDGHPGAVAPRRRPRSGSSTPAVRRARRTPRSPTPTRSRALFAELVDEFGALDAVVNVAGISRPTGFAAR